MNALFLGAGLVDEVWLTVEPVIFGQGVDLFRGAELNVRARLIHMEQLNETGTLHLRYAVK